MARAANPLEWQDDDGATPPVLWEAIEADGRWWWYGEGEVPRPNTLYYIGAERLPPVLEFDWEIVERPEGGFATIYFNHYIEGVGSGYVELGNNIGSGRIQIETAGATPGGEFYFYVDSSYGAHPYGGVVAVLGPYIPQAAPFNCDCADEHPDRTLAELRVSLLRRLGFSAQAANPPPGMTELLDDFIRDAQYQLYRRHPTLRTQRFFRWTMDPGQRFYAIRGDERDGICDLRLDPYKITWVGVEDLNGAWIPLHCGIPPTLYTNVAQRGIPARYEVRQCIEVFPAPDREYNLRVKGHFGLQPLTDPTHRTTIDSEAVFLLALAQAKAHYRQPDASNYFAQANSLIGSLVGGGHHTRRYVPNARELAPETRPRMVQWDDGTS